MPEATQSYNLQIINPSLSKEWHPTQNGSLTPKDVAPGSDKIVWWLCKKEGHKWPARIQHRNNGIGCPYCSGRYATKENNLQKINPELAREWHPTKNGSLMPKNVTPGSGKKVWWKCKQGHEWEAKIAARAKKNTGCPKCVRIKHGEIYKRLAVKRSGSLADTHPTLANEWHPTKNQNLTPHDRSAGSHEKVWWQCKIGHEWQAVIKHRNKGAGCPYCKGRYLTYERSLEYKFPEISKELHPTKNEKLTGRNLFAFNNKKVWWKCKKGHEYQAVVASRTSMKSGCPVCRSAYSLLELRVYCELKTLFEDVKWREIIKGKECDIFIPRLKVAIEVDGYPWHSGKEQKDRKKTNALAILGIKTYRLRDQRLGTLSPEDILFKYSESKDQKNAVRDLVRILMANEHLNLIEHKKAKEYLLSHKFRNQKEFKKIQSTLPGPPPGESLFDLYPEKSKYWDYEKNFPLTPQLFSAQSHQKVWWFCEKGHESKERIQNRILRPGIGCGKCGYKKRAKKGSIKIAETKHCLADHYTELVKEWHPKKNGDRTPYNVPVSSSIIAWWICSKGHEYDMTVSKRTGERKDGCPYCSNMRVGKDNNLAVLYKDLAKEWHPTKNGKLSPSDVVPGTPRKVWWICPKNHEYEKQVRARAIFKQNCPFCSGRKVGKDNNLEILFPEIAKQWHPTKNGNKKPSNYSRGSGVYAWWICENGHEWRTKIQHRTISKSGCPYCSRRRK